MSSKILGLSFGYHDSSATLLIDGTIAAASAQERFSRRKHDEFFPKDAIDFCLQSAGILASELDFVAYYENPIMKLERICTSSLLQNDRDYFVALFSKWMAQKEIDIKEKISRKLSIQREKIILLDHHLSHASAAFFASPYDEAAVLTLDGVGEFETATIYKGEKNNLVKLASIELPKSIGLFYSAFTSFLGFEVNEGEYKVMGMAAYGEPRYYSKIRKLVGLSEDDFWLDGSYFSFLAPKERMYTDKLLELFGEPRAPKDSFFTMRFSDYAPKNLNKDELEALALKNQKYADIAASLQKITEEIILMLAQKAMKICDSKNLCLAGGVALNSVANMKIRENLKPRGFFVQPNAGDGGSSMGAAMYCYHVLQNKPKKESLKSAFLGSEFSASQILKQIKENSFEELFEFEDTKKLNEFLVQKLLDKCVIGWFNGKAEWGPRALGARSILAAPIYSDIKDIVNAKIKFRELFRPFAPSVLAEYAHEWFEIESDLNEYAPESFMLSVARVKDSKKAYIPAVVHVDNTARIQLVHKSINPTYHALIDAFYQKSGVPILLNTSFNLKGEPIVNSPKDAILTFSYSWMDYLAMPPYVLKSYWSNK